MNILITGGAGFIGSHLCDSLLSQGHNIVVIDNLSLGRMNNIEHLIPNDSFQFEQFDILDLSAMRKVFDSTKFDCIFHMAANSDIAISHDHPSTDMENTFMTTYNVLLMMKEFDVKKIVFASTSAIYGDTDKNLIEDFGPLQPVSHYGAGKLASEAFMTSFGENYEIQSWICRFPNVVGERATHGVIFDFINKLKKNPEVLEVLGNGEQFKPYLYVKDLVDAILFIWEKTDKKLNVFNIGVTSRTKVKDIAKFVIEEMGLNAEIAYTGGSRGWVGDVPEFNYDLSKITDLGWSAEKTSNEAVRIAIRSILDND